MIEKFDVSLVALIIDVIYFHCPELRYSSYATTRVLILQFNLFWDKESHNPTGRAVAFMVIQS